MPSATPVAGTFVPFELAAGDLGVRSIQTITLGTAYTTAVIHAVAYRVLARVDIGAANGGTPINPFSGGFPRLYNDTVPFFLFLPTATTATTFHAIVNYSHG